LSKTLHLKLEQQYQEPLEQLAKEAGFLWGERGNITALLRALANREVAIGLTSVVLTLEEQQALMKAIRYLLAQGNWGTVKSLSRFLQGEGTDPITRAQLEVLLEPVQASSIKEIERCLQKKQPFALTYQDAAGRSWSFTVQYAEFVIHEDRQYLDCWCQETEGNHDIPELQHNWCLRLDRIREASIIPLQARWRSSLDTVEVVSDLFGGLAHAYRVRPEDLADEWIEIEGSHVRRIHRKINSTFWFIREVLRYGADCEVRSPEPVRSRIRQQLQVACDRY
jgi:predicted DNA-binding transcriptional regulator YafY